MAHPPVKKGAPTFTNATYYSLTKRHLAMTWIVPPQRGCNPLRMTRLTEARKSRHQTQTPLTQRNRIIIGPLVKRRTHIMAKTGQGWGKKNHRNGLRSNRRASVADLAVNSVVASLEFLTTGSILVPERAQHYQPNCSASKVIVIAMVSSTPLRSNSFHKA